MGRIYEALRRSSVEDRLDAGGEAAKAPSGGRATAPGPSPRDARPATWCPEQPVALDVFKPGPSLPIQRAQEEVTNRPKAADKQAAAQLHPTWPVFMERLVVGQAAPPLLVEQFRSLAATLHNAQGDEQPLKTLLVTSASPGDGKSYVSINLALTLSESYSRRVLLIDADLRRPTLHRLFGISHGRGLGEELRARTNGNSPTVRVTDTLTLLPAGRPDPNPLGGLSSDRMREIVASAASAFDWVIVDSPPVGVIADGRLVSNFVDGAILVVRAGVTPFRDVQAAAATIGHERILGIVLNGVEPSEIRGKHYYNHYYGRDQREG